MKAKKTIKLLILCLAGLSAYAQKLPNVQKTGIPAPTGIKIDGKTGDWHEEFQAHNNATLIDYTMANDNDKLYLLIRATDPIIIDKILRGGITLSINIKGDKSDKGAVSITYPIFERKNNPNINVNRKPVINDTDKQSVKTADSVMAVNNEKLGTRAKYMMVKGIKGTDSIISVYNDNGIRVASLFNNRMDYNYELSVDLKQLGFSVSGTATFAYHIKLNGVSTVDVDDFISPGKTAQDGSPKAGVKSMMSAELMAKLDMIGSTSPTDFWGTYTLIK